MKQMLAVLLSAGLLAVSTGCGALLERDYTQVTDHVDQTADTGDATALRAEGYAEQQRPVLCDHGGRHRHGPPVPVHGGH